MQSNRRSRRALSIGVTVGIIKEIGGEMDDYILPTEINGEQCGLAPFLFTVAIVVGIDKSGYRCRYCYPSLIDAMGAYADWISLGGPEPSGYIKRKP